MRLSFFIQTNLEKFTWPMDYSFEELFKMIIHDEHTQGYLHISLSIDMRKVGKLMNSNGCKILIVDDSPFMRTVPRTKVKSAKTCPIGIGATVEKRQATLLRKSRAAQSNPNSQYD